MQEATKLALPVHCAASEPTGDTPRIAIITSSPPQWFLKFSKLKEYLDWTFVLLLIILRQKQTELNAANQMHYSHYNISECMMPSLALACILKI